MNVRSNARPRAATPTETCRLCGGAGQQDQRPLEDRAFGIPGTYHLQRCRSCGLVWLQDMPDEQDVGRFYEGYYTHAPKPVSGTVAGRRRQLVAKVWPVTATQRSRRREMYQYFLPDNGGRVLEAGCGSGANLAALRERGWDVVGQDIDPASAETAMNHYGVHVEVGSIADVDLPEASFDAVLLNHVVEHLREPERDLERCRRLLAPGGTLVIITPNIDSVGARWFGRYWRGLEPPRHLFIYNVATLRSMLEKAGFASPEVFTRSARSEMISWDTVMTLVPRWPGGLKYAAAKGTGMATQLYSDLTRADHRDAGDELVALATVPRD